MKKLLLMDGNNVMFRAYFATAAMGNLMCNKDGFPTNMIYGFINIFNRFRNEGYTHMAVAFDKGSKTRRHQEFKDYKAGRAETPHELIEQIPYLHKFLDAANVHYYMSDYYEADDIVASIRKKFYDDFDEIDVLSNDNDLFQLISEKSFQLYTKNKETIKYSETVLFEDKKIKPIQIPDYKGLIGDKSDNLLGVEGIGPVGAAKLLGEYPTLEEIYENIESIKGKTKDKLEAGKEQAFFTKRMAILDPTFEFEETVDDFMLKEPDYDKLREFYTELDFKSFLMKLPRSSSKPSEFSYKIVNDPFSIDFIKDDETNYLVLDLLFENYHTAPKVGFGLSNSNGNFFIPYEVGISSLDFTMFLNDKDIKKCVYDYKKMYVAMLDDGVVLDGISSDILLASYILDTDLSKGDMSLLAQEFGVASVLPNEMVYGKKGRETFPDLETYSKHVASKADCLRKIASEIESKIRENSQEDLLYDIEIPFSKVLGDMEHTGLRVDPACLERYETDLLDELKMIEKEIYDIAGHEFNILSPKQLGEVLFDELGLPYLGKKSKANYSTDQSTLEPIIGYPIVERVLRYRMLSKLESTYVIGVKTAINEKSDDHIHTIYKQALTDTGRLSSTEPNLQNLPIRNKEASEFRKVFVPEKDSVLLSSDYSQIELRVLAHMAGEENLINAFLSGEDIHTATAKAVFNKKEVTKEERSRAKAVNFGIIYGISSWGLSNDIGITPREATMFIDRYHESFPGIQPFTNALIDMAKKEGYVETMFGRRRYIRDINSPQFQVREFAKRTAMNAPIQGTAADILKIAMIKVDKEIKRLNLHAKLIMTIHDEIVLNVPKVELERTIEVVEKTMEESVILNAPLKVESGYGNTLYEAK